MASLSASSSKSIEQIDFNKVRSVANWVLKSDTAKFVC
ncbi:hypothetical protein D020_1525 [Vibrio parahaemolyticus SBR10290]|nr:hypothetical protein VpaChn25_1341 [Vibrio parahaemolyticus]EFO40657.1 conserved hypothetical protein [Vibrio parahaemolyticus AN-5034]EQL89052.1 hypothetical protein D052_2861 [Vibrio parahaemolyticus 10290]EQL91999.1 hypothetical protein D036_3476 [Vibrio parahaemolyticus VP232]EQL95229.1 hypothetical protein D035_1626 [Vibrio parahaemolyticus VP250]EQM01606.1 hypothetical protein D040_3869 [Vibrio parahaemolyticus NIHCB0603]EQM09380.1 hypothetical protein D045_3900 [Vibrio parahaemolyti